jgi:sec-independent protein translocase protein TatC
VEPFWCFGQYFDFIGALLFASGLAFQIPILQVALGFLGLVSAKRMIGAWKYVVVIAASLSAVLTPSTDPVTQLVMTLALLVLYFLGSISVLIIEKGTTKGGALV